MCGPPPAVDSCLAVMMQVRTMGGHACRQIEVRAIRTRRAEHAEVVLRHEGSPI